MSQPENITVDGFVFMFESRGELNQKWHCVNLPSSLFHASLFFARRRIDSLTDREWWPHLFNGQAWIRTSTSYKDLHSALNNLTHLMREQNLKPAGEPEPVPSPTIHTREPVETSDASAPIERYRVPGGWLYHVCSLYLSKDVWRTESNSLCFVPDPKT